MKDAVSNVVAKVVGGMDSKLVKDLFELIGKKIELLDMNLSFLVKKFKLIDVTQILL